MNNAYEKTSGITMKEKLGYACGDVASLLVFGLVNTILQIFYTDSLGIAPLAVMLIMIVARIWDAVNDPLWGRVVDKTPCKKKGTRYRRWLLFLCVPLAISAVLMFIDVKSLGFSNAATIVYACVTYIVFGMLYTGTNIPYGSLASVITTDDKERNSLSVFRSAGSTIGGFGAMALYMLCYNGSSREFNTTILIVGVIILAVLSVGAYLVCYFTTKERVIVEPKVLTKEEKKNSKGTIASLCKTKSFLIISIVGMLFLAAQMYQTTYNSYVFKYFFDHASFSTLTTICQYLPVVVVMFLSGKLVRKFGRKEICAIGLLFTAISYLVLACIPTSIDKTILMWIFIFFSLLSGIGNSFIFLMIWALANDAIDDYYVRTKRHDEATAYAVFTFMRKLGQTLAAIFVNVCLILLGYGANGSLEFDLTVSQAQGMYYQSIIIPGVLSLIMFALLFFIYPLNKKKVIELQDAKKQMYLEDGEEVAPSNN